jgi:hypothetical protein
MIPIRINDEDEVRSLNSSKKIKNNDAGILVENLNHINIRNDNDFS